MAEHTPGPWVASMQKSREGRNLGWIIETERGDRIGWSHYGDVETNKDDGNDYPVSGANARLIAAAPDLLRVAIVAAESLAQDHGRRDRLVPGRDRTWGELETALRAAITKATGGDR